MREPRPGSRWLVAILIFLFGLALPAAADEKQFFGDFTKLLLQQNWQAATDLATRDRALAERTFNVVRELAKREKAGSTEQKTEMLFLYTVARIFEVKLGDPRLVDELKQAGLLADNFETLWKGTMLESAGADAALQKADMLARLGAFDEAQPLYFDLTQKAIAEGKLERVFSLTARLANIVFVRSMLISGNGQGAQEFKALLKQVQEAPNLDGPAKWTLELSGLLGMGEIAMAAGHFREAEKLFKQALTVAPKLNNLEGDVGAFAARSWLYSIDSTRHAAPTAAELEKKYRECNLFPAHPGSTPTVLPGTATRYTRVCEYWIDQPWTVLTELSLNAGSDPSKQQEAIKQVADLVLLSLTIFRPLDSQSKTSEEPEILLGAARAKVHLGGHLGHLGQRPDEAEALFKQAEETLSKLRQKLQDVAGHPARSLALDELEGNLAFQRALTLAGRTLGDAKSPFGAQATAMMKRSVEIYSKAGLTRGGLEARSKYVTLLYECRPPGWEQEFDTSSEEALLLARQFEDPVPVFATLFVQAQALALRGLPAKALPRAQESVKVLEELMVEADVGDEGRRRFRQLAKPLYDLLTSLLVKENRPQEAFTALARGQQLETVISEPTQIHSSDPEVRQNLERLSQTKMQTRGLQKDLQNLKAIQADPKQIQTTTQLLAKSRSEFFVTVERLRSKHPKYSGLLAVQPVEFAKLQRKIPVDTLVVQIYPTDTQTYLFLISSDSFKIKTVSVTADKLDSLVSDFRRGTQRYARSQGKDKYTWQDNGSAYYKSEVAPYKETLSNLYQTLIDPIGEEMATKKVVAFIPTGTLLYLPMAALGHTNAEGKWRFLIEEKQVVALVRAVDIDHLGNHPTNANGKVLALGNPDGTLAMAKEEVLGLKAHFPSADVFTGDQATEARVTKGYDFVHLATHGVLDRQDPTQSYLTVAGSGEKSRLRVTRIFDLPLASTRLVTLSACETALGEPTPGAAITNLAEAFWVAGAPTVVASLWSVEDNSTKELMVDFYGNIHQGQRLSEALQGAQRKMLVNPKYSHPFFWSPFILIGDWQ